MISNHSDDPLTPQGSGDPSDTTEPDPLDLEAFRASAHELVDWITDYMANLDERPVIEPVSPGDVRAKLPDRAPERSEPVAAMLADLDRVVLPGLSHWQHPGWFAFFPAQASPLAILGEMAAAGLGVQGMLWSTSPAATEIESHVIDWLVDLLGVPQEWKTTSRGGGVLQSGASDSTHTALVVAREECRNRSGAPAENMVAYTSSQAHSSVEKGARMAGYGHLRLLETDQHFAATPQSLIDSIGSDLDAGLTPTCVCTNIGTTGTASVDPLRRFGEIAREHNLWHHVDAAYAGSAMICEEFRHHQDGLELVDSYTFNPHKWLATNLDCSVMWVADRRPLIETLSVLPPYLRNEASASGKVIDYRDWTGPLGRRFRALKLWFVLRAFGAEGLRQMIRKHVRWARELTERVESHPRLELFAPTLFALVSFTHIDGNQATDYLANAINASGRFYLTVSETDGRRYVRVSIGSIWTTKSHVEALWELIRQHS